MTDVPLANVLVIIEVIASTVIAWAVRDLIRDPGKRR
jgi:hypothetical protein